MNSKLVVFRGLPGSGKSTMARKMQKTYVELGETVGYYEADMFFMTDTGEYKFEPNKLPLAHAWCREHVREALKNCDTVIVANTNLAKKDMDLWDQIAKSCGASLQVFHLKTMWGSIHGVPEETMEKMRRKEIDWPGEIVIMPALGEAHDE